MGETETPTPRTSGPVMPLVLLAVLGLLATVVAVAFSSSPASADELARFGSCDELRAFQETTVERQRAGGVAMEDGADGFPLAGTGGGGDAASAGAPAPAAAETDTRGSDQLATTDDADVGATNTQVQGVDELDRADVAPDGRVLVGLDARWSASAQPDPTTGVVEPEPAELVLVGADGAVAARAPLDGFDPRLTWDVSRDVAWVVTSPQGVDRSLLQVQRYRTDGGLRLDGSWTVSGWAVTGRRLDDRFVLIATDQPWQIGVMPFASGEGDGDATAVPCDQVWHPTSPTTEPGGTLVAAFDAGSADVAPVVSAQIVGSAGTVYASADAVYVTTTTGAPFPMAEGPATEPRTAVHRFALDDLRLTGSGTVPGHPLNQFSIDEHDGHLRIATTLWGAVAMPVDDIGGDARILPAPAPPGSADNLVTVLDLEGDLDQVGQVGGLGEPGETIQSVRFQGPVGYVVTFRQTDPLYVLDLADPRSPRAVGELKIPGFSSYLHPVGDGLVVGIGSAGDEQGLTGGAWVQLFDVSDRQHPALLASDDLGDASEAQHDHHAFAALGAGRFAVPFQELDQVLFEPTAPDGGTSPPAVAPMAVRLYDTADRALARGPELAFEIDQRTGSAFVRTAELADGTLLVIAGDGHLHRYSSIGTRTATTTLR